MATTYKLVCKRDGWSTTFEDEPALYGFWSKLISSWDYDAYEINAAGEQHLMPISDKEKMAMSPAHNAEAIREKMKAIQPGRLF